MRLEETVEAEAWLKQFDIVDREVARQLLRRLTLVSQSDFEKNLQSTIEDVINRIGKENAALLSITEPPNSHDPEGVRRIPGSSSDRVKHLIENLSRIHGDRVRANPTVQSMRAERVRNIILVEDFIGSGDRILGYWRDEISPSIKSWVSFGWTKIWIVSYATLASGFRALRRTIPITEDRIFRVLPEADRLLQLTPPMLALAEKYGRKLRGHGWAGYSGGGGALVFQHGCPNNAPAILWAKVGRYCPLFPNRGIPTGLQACFGEFNYHATAEVLWTFRQYRLALVFVGDLKTRRADQAELLLALALGLASSFGRWDDAKLQTQLMLPRADIEQLKHKAYELYLIDNQNHRLTAFAVDLLAKLKANRSQKKKKVKVALPSLQDLYYPDTCGGLAQSRH